MTPDHWRQAALLALGLQVVGLLAVAGYALWNGDFSLGAWFLGTSFFLRGLVLAWWTAVFGRFTLGQDTTPGKGVLRALALAFPWITSWRLVLWFMTLLSVLSGAVPEANTVALTALLTVWPASILATNAVYGSLARLAPNTADLAGRKRLADWLNVAAALSLGMAVFNVVPIAGFSTAPTATDQLVYGLGGALDVAATLLALRAVQAAPLAEGEGR